MKIRIKNKEYEVEIIDNNQGKIIIKVDNKEFEFSLEENKLKNILPISSVKKQESVKEIKAPLTGTISDIFIREGEEIKQGKKLLILSAMKMENEILCTHDSKIKKILIEKNQKVKEGDPLIILF